MLNTFEALAKFPENENNGDNDPKQQNDTNATVDLSAIINRLNEMEIKINELVNKTTTDFPTRGTNDSTPIDNGVTDNGTDDNKGE